MAKVERQHPVIFSEGWDTRGSGVGEPVRVVDIKNAWLSRTDLGAIESMPSDGVLFDFSGGAAGSLSNIVALSVGENQEGFLPSDGEWPGEGVPSGLVAIVAIDKAGKISYARYTDPASFGTLLGAVTQPTVPGISSIVRIKDTFYIFQGCDPNDRVPQQTIIGSTQIKAIGLNRPDTTDVNGIYAALNPGGSENVKGPVRYWIARIEQGNESALSEAIRRQGDQKNDLYFDGTQKVDWTDIFDKDGASDFTLECIVSIDPDHVGDSFIFGKRSKDADSAGYSIELKASGGMRVRLRDSTLTSYDADTEDTIANALSHHLSAVYDATAQTITLYRNGEIQEITSTATMTTLANAFSFTAGLDGDGLSGFKGRIYEFRLWSEARSQADIRSLLFQSIPNPAETPEYDNLEGYWPTVYDSGNPTTLADAKGSNDGTLDDEEMWGVNVSYGEAVINCGDGSRVDIVFASTVFHGQEYKIYRSFNGGAVPFFLAQFKPTAPAVAGVHDVNDTYTDDILDAYLGDVPFVHGDRPPPLAVPSVVHLNRIFLAYRSRIYWSDIANEESFWWQDDSDPDGHNEVGNWVSVFPDDGDKITALASDFDSLIIFKSNHIYRLYGRKPEEFNLRPYVPSSDTPVTVGCPNHSSVCGTPLGIVFYWNRKVYMMSGGVIQKISDPIEESLNAIDWGGGTNANNEHVGASVGYWAGREQVWLSLPDNSSTGTPTVTYIYDLARRVWIGYRDAGYQGATSFRAADTWVSALRDEQFIGGVGGTSGAGSVAKIAFSPDVAIGGSYAELSPFYGSGFNNIKKFLYVDVDYESSATGAFNIEHKIDDVSYTSFEVDMSAGTIGRRYRARVNIMETGRELQIKFSEDESNTKWKVLGMTYGWQDHPVISR